MARIAFLVCILVPSLLPGCSTTKRPLPPEPTAAEIEAADIGPKPDLTVMEKFAKKRISAELRDPMSAVFNGGIDAPRAWYRDSDGVPVVTWVYPIGVNAKNGFGGYTGEKIYVYFVKHNEVVAITEPNPWGVMQTIPVKPALPLPTKTQTVGSP